MSFLTYQALQTDSKMLSGMSVRSLLDAQLFCFGRDIERADGNGLLAYGFSKHRPPRHRSGAASVYVLDRAGGPWVVLRGFGIALARDANSAIFIDRQFAKPRLVSQRTGMLHAWLLDDMPPLVTPRSHADRALARLLLAAACRWMADYESWASDRWGGAYRRECLRLWPGSRRCGRLPSHLHSIWRRLARLAGGGA
jgi:hypothetical protein